MLAGADNTSWGHKSTFVPATWNPADKNAAYTLSNGNLTISAAGGDYGARGTIGIDLDAGESGYYEATLDAEPSYFMGVGTLTAPISGTNPHGHAESWLYSCASGYLMNTSGIAGPVVGASDVLMVAIKGTSIWAGANGVWFNSGDPGAGTGAFYTNLSGVMYPMMISGGTFTCNFGQSAFAYGPPSGFAPGWGYVE